MTRLKQEKDRISAVQATTKSGFLVNHHRNQEQEQVDRFVDQQTWGFHYNKHEAEMQANLFGVVCVLREYKLVARVFYRKRVLQNLG